LAAREKALRSELDASSKYQTAVLTAKRQKLDEHIGAVTAALSTQNTLILDADLDSAKREAKIKQIADDAIRMIDGEDLEVAVAPAVFGIDGEAVAKFISSIGSLSVCADAPRLTVSDISSTSAVLSLQSEFESAAVRFQIKYRRDEEKDAEWKTVDIAENASKCTLKGLSADTRYVVTGRLKEMETKMFSPMCDAITFETECAAIAFEFDPQKKSGDITLSKGNTTASKTGSNSCRSVLCKTKLCAETMSAVHWELTLRGRRADQIAMMIGFLNGAEYAKANLCSYFGKNADGRRGASLDIYHSNNKFRGYTNGTQTDLDDIGHQPKDCKVGDRFEIEFDFVGKQAIAFYNGQRLGLITNELPENVYPSLCLAFIGEKVETTKFEITYK